MYVYPTRRLLLCVSLFCFLAVVALFCSNASGFLRLGPVTLEYGHSYAGVTAVQDDRFGNWGIVQVTKWSWWPPLVPHNGGILTNTIHVLVLTTTIISAYIWRYRYKMFLASPELSTRCRSCGYDCAGIKKQCPECGASVR